jgi:hypothetical protein
MITDMIIAKYLFIMKGNTVWKFWVYMLIILANSVVNYLSWFACNTVVQNLVSVNFHKKSDIKLQ